MWPDQSDLCVENGLHAMTPHENEMSGEQCRGHDMTCLLAAMIRGNAPKPRARRLNRKVVQEATESAGIFPEKGLDGGWRDHDIDASIAF
ncbi:hypothetical protein N7532_003337 [Penicillium argentinense]|uniref:Uncharacterized protein n=1 Tax=Penicillium argentinense TaxID=1131581 RepID=A0A9W9KEJ8_9EURO|nr:uncharacterized protein N7532_003337 [Penicillium argentinense]KAJ5102808.1 hypothetical protein N7532_003337 [Penicillium argentinense]